MTDPEIADRTYIERSPRVGDYGDRARAPDALLPTMGGQTALNIAMALARDGTLERFGVELIGANARAIQMAEVARSSPPRCGASAWRPPPPHGRESRGCVGRRGGDRLPGHYPAVVHPGGTGGGIAYNRAEFEEAVERAIDLSPVHSTLIERSVLGWKSSSWRSCATVVTTS